MRTVIVLIPETHFSDGASECVWVGTVCQKLSSYADKSEAFTLAHWQTRLPIIYSCDGYIFNSYLQLLSNTVRCFGKFTQIPNSVVCACGLIPFFLINCITMLLQYI